LSKLIIHHLILIVSILNIQVLHAIHILLWRTRVVKSNIDNMIGLLQLLDHYIWLNALKLLIIYLRHLDVNIIFIIYFMPKKSWLLGDLNFKHLMRLQHHWLCLIRILYRFHLRMVQVLFSLIKLDQLSGIDLFVIRHQVLNFGAFIRADVA